MPICPNCHSSRFVQHGNFFICLDCNITFHLNPFFPTAKITPETRVEAGENSFIGDYTFIHLKLLKMGRNCYIHPFTAIIGGGELILGDNVSIGYHSLIATATDTWKTGKHMTSALPENKRDVVRGKIVMEDDVWIGPHTTITVSPKSPTVTIGRAAVIGAYSYIDKNVQPNAVIIPSKTYRIKTRDLE
jgi:acetyltransferase-like isoleucine patch superfamily enzyme